MSLSQEERDAIVIYRLEKSFSALEHAKGNAGMGYWEVTANRLYYSAYYAVSALLLYHGHSAQTHAGIIQMFGKNFVKTGIVPIEFGHLYSQLFSMRLTGDYDDFSGLSQEEIEPLIEKTEQFIATVKSLINGERGQTESIC